MKIFILSFLFVAPSFAADRLEILEYGKAQRGLLVEALEVEVVEVKNELYTANVSLTVFYPNSCSALSADEVSLTIQQRNLSGEFGPESYLLSLASKAKAPKVCPAIYRPVNVVYKIQIPDLEENVDFRAGTLIRSLQ